MFNLRKHSAHDTGKPKAIRRVGMQPAIVESYLDYQIEITQRPASPISKRVLFSVSVDGGEPLLRSYLTGFTSEKTARVAAHQEVQKLEEKFSQDGSPIPNILASLKRQRAARQLQEKLNGKRRPAQS